MKIFLQTLKNGVLFLLLTNSCLAVSHLTERLPFQDNQSTDCQMTVSNVMVINCPGKNFIYHTDQFVKTGNKGTRNYGSNQEMVGVHQTVDKNPQGHIAFVDPNEQKIYKVYATSSGVGQFKLMSYNFMTTWQERIDVTDMVVFDMSFVVVVLNKSYLAVLKVDYSRFNDEYTNEDLRAIHDNETQILQLKGFKNSEDEHMLITVELSVQSQYSLNLYSLTSDNIQPSITPIYSLDLGSLPIVQIDMSDSYVVLSQMEIHEGTHRHVNDRGNNEYGVISVYNMDTFELVYKLNGKRSAENIGRSLRIESQLTQGLSKAYNIYYSNFEEERELVNQFYIGRISIIESSGGAPIISNEFRSFTQKSQHFTEDKSQSSDFAIVENILFAKQSANEQIEIAGFCPFMYGFNDQPIGETTPMCQECSDGFSLGMQKQCQSCGSASDQTSLFLQNNFCNQDEVTNDPEVSQINDEIIDQSEDGEEQGNDSDQLVDENTQTDILNNNYETEPTPQIIAIDVESNQNGEEDEQSKSEENTQLLIFILISVVAILAIALFCFGLFKLYSCFKSIEIKFPKKKEVQTGQETTLEAQDTLEAPFEKFKKKMTKDELAEKEQQEIKAIITTLKATGMPDQEINKQIRNLQIIKNNFGTQKIDENSYDNKINDSERTLVASTMNPKLINHDDIELQLMRDQRHQPLEIDENEIPISPYTEKKIVYTPTKIGMVSKITKATDDDCLNKRSTVSKRPRLNSHQRRNSRVIDMNSIKAGSMEGDQSFDLESQPRVTKNGYSPMKLKKKADKSKGSAVMAQITNTFKNVTPVKVNAVNQDQMSINMSLSNSKNSENAPQHLENMENFDSDSDTNHNVKNLIEKPVLPSALRSKIPDQYRVQISKEIDQDLTVPQEQIYDQIRNMEENLRL